MSSSFLTSWPGKLATRKALVRARQIAAVCAVLAVAAAGSAVFGYFGMKRAQEAELKAQQTRQLAEQARGEAEKLIVYLLDDFYLELEPVGRLDIVAELAKRAVNYYHELPPELRTAETDRNRALALVRYGAALRNLSRLDEGGKALTEAVAILDRLRLQGDTSEITAIGLGLGLAAQARTADSLNQYAEAAKFSERAEAILAPLMAAPSPSVPLRRAYGSVMNYRGYAQLRSAELDQSVKSLEASRQAYKSIDNLAFTDLAAAAGYAEATAWQTEAIRSQGRLADAKARGEEGVQVAGKILEKRPAYMGALRARALMNSNLADIEADQLHLNRSLALGDAGTRDWEDFLKLDPGNVIAWNNLAANYERNAYSLFRLGRINEGRDLLVAAAAVEKRTKMSNFFAVNMIFPNGFLAQFEADTGNPAKAEAALAEVHRLAKIADDGREPGSSKASLKMLETGFRIVIPQANWDFVTVRRMLVEAIPDASVAKPSGGQAEWIWNVNMENRHRELAWADYNLMAYTDAEKAIRQGMVYQKRVPERTLERLREEGLNQIILAMALARLDRQPEAQQAVAPALKFYRDLKSRNSEDLTLRIEYAQALFAQALAANDAAALAESAAIIDGLPPAMRSLKSTTLIRKQIADEQASRRK